MKKRLFIALNSPPIVQSNIYEIEEEWRRRLGDEVRWVAPNLTHITIHFLGDVEEGREADILKIMRQSLDDLTPFVFALQNLGAFPGLSHARTVVVHVTEIEGHPLQILHKRLANKLRVQGFVIDDRTFMPHLTLGRLRRPSRVTTAWYKHRPITWSAWEVHLMESLLSPDGAQYKTIATAHLS